MTHYECLGLSPNATLIEIREAYLNLARNTHPDKALGKEEQFKAIAEAYEVLRDPAQRELYDQSLINPPQAKKQYRLHPQPYTLNHYEYANYFLKLHEGAQDYLTPGQVIDKGWLWLQLYEISGRLYAHREQLERKYKKTAQDLKLIKLFFQNEDKIGQLQVILTGGDKEKFLYDLFLGPDIVPQTEEMQAMLQLIGGRERLHRLFKQYPILGMAGSIFALHEAGCLNPANFDRLLAAGKKIPLCLFTCSSHVITNLLRSNLLNQANFELALAHKEEAARIFGGICALKHIGLFNQKSFEALLHCGKHAERAGTALRRLYENKLLTKANQKMALRLVYAEKEIDLLISPFFQQLNQQNLLTLEDREFLQWRGDGQELQHLSERIDEMFAYGLFLLAEDDEAKARPVCILALTLKKSLKVFFEKPPEQQQAEHQLFKEEFLELLHSEDKAFAEHRSYWKVVVANIAIAFTGIGLFALTGYALYTGHCFFRHTQRENLRETVEKSFDLPQSPSIGG